jgi:hypothetical protein
LLIAGEGRSSRCLPRAAQREAKTEGIAGHQVVLLDLDEKHNPLADESLYGTYEGIDAVDAVEASTDGEWVSRCLESVVEVLAADVRLEPSRDRVLGDVGRSGRREWHVCQVMDVPLIVQHQSVIAPAQCCTGRSRKVPLGSA